jgi:Flp pilus assembly protein TadG
MEANVQQMRSTHRHVPSPRGSGRERGASAVEFALIVPILLMIVFATVQFGMAMAQKASLANGAREGARVGAVNFIGTHTCGAVVNKARANSVTLGVSANQVEVTVDRMSSAGAATQICKANANVAMASTVGAAPCTNVAATASTEQTVRVTTQLYGRKIGIPLLPAVPLTVKAVGEFRCEYH